MGGSPIQAGHADPARFVHIRGANSILPMAQLVAERYMAEFPEVSVAVSAGGGLRAFQSVMDGSAEIGMLASDLPEAAARAPGRGIRLVQVPFGYDAVVNVVHAANPVQSLSRLQIEDIFCGRIRNWADLGGADAPIRLFRLYPDAPAHESWEDTVLTPGATIDQSAAFMGTSAMVRAVASAPTGIGYVRLSAVTPAVRAVAIDGIAATAESIRTGRYLIRRPLSLLHTHRASQDTVEFVRYFTAPQKGLRFAPAINAVPVE